MILAWISDCAHLPQHHRIHINLSIWSYSEEVTQCVYPIEDVIPCMSITSSGVVPEGHCSILVQEGREGISVSEYTSDVGRSVQSSNH